MYFFLFFISPFIIIIIIIIIITGKDTISFMQGIYTYILETNNVPKEYNIATILSLLFMVPISLAPVLALMYFYISTFWSMCAVPNMAVFCSSLTSWFPSMVLTYFLNDFEMVRRSSYYRHHPSFYIPHTLYFYCKALISVNYTELPSNARCYLLWRHVSAPF
jgi:hypothetical protein